MIPFYSSSQGKALEERVNNIEQGGSGSIGKIWHELELSAEEAYAVTEGQTVVKKLEKQYDPSTFSKDYFHLQLDNEANLVGSLVKVGGDITKVYADFTTPAGGFPDWMSKDVNYGLRQMMKMGGFDHNYYGTVVIYAGMTEPEDGDYTLSGANVLEGKNVVYVQDVTQQDWERNPNENEKEKVRSREGLSSEYNGNSYVLHIKGDTAEANLLFCYYDEQAAYWDSTANDIRWANVEGGKIYHVTFDGTGTGQHSSLRWLLTMEGNQPKEYTAAELQVLLETGIAFEANKVAAEAFVDTTAYQKGIILGNSNDNLVSLFSINEPFEADYRDNLEIIGRPSGRVPDYIDWYDDEEEKWIDCYDGYYAWGVVVDGISVAIIIPDMDDYRDRLIVRSYSANGSGSVISIPATPSYNSEKLYRHTISIYTSEPVTTESGESIALNICFCAVNCQAGDDAMAYVLYSDEKKQYPAPDWVLPASGLIKIDSNVYTVERIQASYTDDTTTERCLKIDYLDGTTLARTSKIVITESNQKQFTCRNFRSQINDFLVSNADVAIVDKGE